MLTTKNAAVALALLLSLSHAPVWPQTASPEKQSNPVRDPQAQQLESTAVSSAPSDSAQTAEPSPAPVPAPAAQKINDPELKQTKRIFGVMPNYTAVSARTEVPPLSVREKFDLAMHDSVDYSSFVLVGLLSAQSMVMKSYPEFHRGVSGYSRYYWRAFADQASGTFFTEAIVPAITHEDPRYYTLGHGGFRRRTMYALSRVVVTKTDSGGSEFNFSEIVGNGLEAGLSNLYYPARDRSLHNTVTNWATMTLITGAANILKEFWPDIRRHMPGQK
ncbi:MAG TPA: hypothetical protein VJ723_01165 [Candidatus Angelobacter sp.]|nr:hypothetical protein [Candidatus Angelobacter sp.]